MGRLGFVLATVAVAMLSIQDARAGAVGAVTDVTWGQSRNTVDREIALLREAGVTWIRANVNWAGLEPNAKGEISEDQVVSYDYAVDQARAAGLHVLMPISDGVPYWASGDPNKYVDASGVRHWNRFYAPRDPADYGDIVRFVVDRYKTSGVHTFEIWNEPNHAWFWPSGPDPAAYLPLLRAGYTAAKSADPESTVLLGGLAKSDFGFLEGLYRIGGGANFDAVAVHPYTYGVDPTTSWNGVNPGEDPSRISKNSFAAIQEIRRTMERHGDGRKLVWITEFGYSTTSGDGGVSEALQAEYLTKAYQFAERLPWVHSMFWYAARNNPFGSDRDAYEDRFGLFTTDWRQKPSYGALKQYAAGAARRSTVVADPFRVRLILRFKETLRGRVIVTGNDSMSAAQSWQKRRVRGRVVSIQQLKRGAWRLVVRLRTDRQGSFRITRPIYFRAGTKLRAVTTYRVGPQRSLTSSRVIVSRRR
jgi:arabinogalactan endo-1,4-beta-galactosidase